MAKKEVKKAAVQEQTSVSGKKRTPAERHLAKVEKDKIKKIATPRGTARAMRRGGVLRSPAATL